DPELAGDVEHDGGLFSAAAGAGAAGPARRIAGPSQHDMGVNIDQGTGVAEVQPVGIIDAGDIVLGRGQRGAAHDEDPRNAIRGLRRVCEPTDGGPWGALPAAWSMLIVRASRGRVCRRGATLTWARARVAGLTRPA